MILTQVIADSLTAQTFFRQVTHREPEELTDHVTLQGVRTLRWTFDWLAGFKTGVIDENKCESQATTPLVSAK